MRLMMRQEIRASDNRHIYFELRIDTLNRKALANQR
jgi:hypothetical protein